MARCTVLELEPLDLDVLGLEVLLGGRRDRGLDIIVDSEGGLLGQLLSGLLCGPDAPGLGGLVDLLGGLSAILGALDSANLTGVDEEDDGASAEDTAAQEEPKPKAKPKRRPTLKDD